MTKQHCWINRYLDQLWKAIIQSWGMMDLIYRRTIKVKCCSHLNVATVMFWRGFSRHSEHLIESIMRCLWTFSCHFSFIHNGNSQSTGQSLKRWVATARKMCFSPLLEMRHSLRLIYFRKQHTFRAASCVSAWARAVNVQRYRRRGVSLAEEPFKWDKLYRNTALLIPFLGVLQSCLHMKRGEAQNTPDSESNHQERVFWQRTWMLKKGYGAGSGSLMWVNEEQVAENTEKKSKWRATPRGEREGSDCPATAANKDWHNERRGMRTIGEGALIQWFQQSSLLLLCEFASGCEVMEI